MTPAPITVLVLVPGFGTPHLQEKLGFLRTNHLYLMAELPDHVRLHYRILHYSENTETNWATVFDPLPPTHITHITHPGLLGENLCAAARPDQLKESSPDYIFMMLDDIEFHAPVPWRDLLSLLNSSHPPTPHPYPRPRILSPCIRNPHGTAWDYMYHQPTYTSPTLLLRNRCEFFVYMMSFADYTHYHSFVSPENPFLWGMDFILASVMKLPPGILNHWTITHHYRGTSAASAHAESQAIRYIERLGLQYHALHQESPGLKAISMRPNSSV